MCYSHDGNAILAVPLKNISAAEIVRAWTAVNNKLALAGIQPSIYILDNEISNEFKTALHKKDIKFQLVPPHIHRRNSAERAFQSFKNHFSAGLASCNDKFPLREWNRLIPQVQITLNLLHNARANPKLSAYAYVFGNYDFNKCPLAPPGTHVVVHSKLNNRATWGFHGKQGWTIGPALEHYRCIKCYISATRAEVNCDTLALFPHNIPCSKVSTEDYLKQATDDIIQLLTNPVAQLPFLQIGDTTKNALLQISESLNRSITNIIDLDITNNIAKKGASTNPTSPNTPIQNKSTDTNKTNNNINPKLPRVEIPKIPRVIAAPPPISPHPQAS